MMMTKPKVYWGNWEATKAKESFVSMVGDFADIYISGSEYFAKDCPIGNVDYWHEKRDLMEKQLARPEWKGIKVLFASYEYGNYSGAAFVLFRKGGKLYEVNASHCSCMGLEGQWTPEVVDIPALQKRLEQRDYWVSDYGSLSVDALSALVNTLVAA